MAMAYFCFVYLVLIMTLELTQASLPSNIDMSTYEEGKRQYELIGHQSQLPQYGQCWKNAMDFIDSGCKQLSDDMQGRLSLAYLNCFLILQGRQPYDCDQTKSVEECTKDMADVDRGSFTTFFTHTQSICYFLQVQIWNEETESTISRLAETSAHVASKIQQSSVLQMEMIRQQNLTLKNQEILMKSATNLSLHLATSAREMESAFSNVREATQAQRILMADMFDHLISLKQVIHGEFSGFYAILYYFFSILVSYLLTSTARTSGARFWLFGIMTVSAICEYSIQTWAPQFLTWCLIDFSEMDDWVYWLRQKCRKLCLSCGLVLLGFFVYRYEDINTANHRLLMEIRKQNSDLKHLLSGRHFGIQPQIQPGVTEHFRTITGDCTVDDGSDFSSTETACGSVESDETYIHHESEIATSESDSYTTAQTLQGDAVNSNAENNSLLEELKELRGVTSLREMPDHVEQWVMTGRYPPSSATVYNGPTHDESNLHLSSRYLLRPRQVRINPVFSPAVEIESPHSFAKTVRQLERLAKQNSKLVRVVTAKKAQMC